MHPSINRSISAVIAAVQTARDELAAYDRDPAYRREDQERDRAAIAARREQSISIAATELGRVQENVLKEFERWRERSFDSVNVAEAWRRVSTLLDSGLGIADVIAAPGFSRETAEALRRNLPAYFTVTMKGERPGTIERRLAEVDEAILKAEIPLMPPSEATATTDELERRKVDAAVRELSVFADTARRGALTAQDQIRLGLTLSEAGFEPEEPTPDPGRKAEAERNSLPPEIRAKLDANVRGEGAPVS